MRYLPLKLPEEKYMRTFNERSTKVFVDFHKPRGSSSAAQREALFFFFFPPRKSGLAPASS